MQHFSNFFFSSSHASLLRRSLRLKIKIQFLLLRLCCPRAAHCTFVWYGCIGVKQKETTTRKNSEKRHTKRLSRIVQPQQMSSGKNRMSGSVTFALSYTQHAHAKRQCPLANILHVYVYIYLDILVLCIPTDRPTDRLRRTLEHFSFIHSEIILQTN